MRSYIFDWAKTLAAYFIFMTMVLNFIPEGQYRKYVRYFFSLILILLLSRPLGQLAGWEERVNKSMDELLYGMEYQESLGAGLYVGEEGQQIMEQACEERIREQTDELLTEYGLELVECVSRVELSGEEPGVRSLKVRARPVGAAASSWPNEGGDTAQRIRERLMGIYELEESRVTVDIE